MKKLFTLLLAFGILSLLPLSAAENRKNEVTLTFELKEKGAPTIHITEAPNGIVIDEYKGKIVLLNFFGKHCKWCMKEIPHLVSLQKKHPKIFQVIAIHAQQPMTPGERHMLEKKFGFNYPIYEYSNNPDFVQYIAHRAQWEGGLPFSIVFDQNGSAVKIIPGYAPEEDLEKIIEVLAKPE
ncbi:TlpA family protein disulfide reductase [Hydrogenimonas urashimensis]|uniref:TlpA family protein disulfide reductase n=1 Tax=Hydrogenimonas urashimensis TaxID=2740515 RepID=UPI001916C4D1|nr:TlpA disulfide reductase family protein [Hydrogenimonas urashimensis]